MPREADFGLRPKALQAAPVWIRECRSAARLACSRLLPATLVQQPFVQEVLDPHALCQSLKPPLIQDGELQIQRRPSPAAHSPGACGGSRSADRAGPQACRHVRRPGAQASRRSETLLRPSVGLRWNDASDGVAEVVRDMGLLENPGQADRRPVSHPMSCSCRAHISVRHRAVATAKDCAHFSMTDRSVTDSLLELPDACSRHLQARVLRPAAARVRGAGRESPAGAAGCSGAARATARPGVP